MINLGALAIVTAQLGINLEIFRNRFTQSEVDAGHRVGHDQC